MYKPTKTVNGLIGEGSGKDELERVKAELEQAMKRIRSLEGELVSLHKDMFGKCMVEKNYKFNQANYMVMDNVSKFIQRELWCYYKFLPRGWEHYHELPDSVCRYIFKNIPCPPLTEKPKYCELVVKPCVNMKYIVLRAKLRRASEKAVFW